MSNSQEAYEEYDDAKTQVVSAAREYVNEPEDSPDLPEMYEWLRKAVEWLETAKKRYMES